MKTHKIKTIEELKAIAEKSFRTLQPVETDREKCSATAEPNGYVGLHFLVLNVLNVAVGAFSDTHNVTNREGTAVYL